jgi:DNA-binding transcriptional MocR family regulator
MTSTKIEWSFNKIAKLSDSADLAEMLFPGNRNQQHAFLVVWFSLKWGDHRMVPNLESVIRKHGISRRTFERVRAKLRRLGLIDHVSRFNARHGCREGWVLSTRFQRSLSQLAAKAAELADAERGSRDKDEMLLEFARVRRDIHRNADAVLIHDQVEQGDEI